MVSTGDNCSSLAAVSQGCGGLRWAVTCATDRCSSFHQAEIKPKFHIISIVSADEHFFTAASKKIPNKAEGIALSASSHLQTMFKDKCS